MQICSLRQQGDTGTERDVRTLYPAEHLVHTLTRFEPLLDLPRIIVSGPDT